MNANAYGGELGRVLEWVELAGAAGLERRAPGELGLAYRSSNLGPGEVVVARVAAARAEARPASGRRRRSRRCAGAATRPSRRGSRRSARPSRTPRTRARRAAAPGMLLSRGGLQRARRRRRALRAQARELHREHGRGDDGRRGRGDGGGPPARARADRRRARARGADARRRPLPLALSAVGDGRRGSKTVRMDRSHRRAIAALDAWRRELARAAGTPRGRAAPLPARRRARGGARARCAPRSARAGAPADRAALRCWSRCRCSAAAGCGCATPRSSRSSTSAITGAHGPQARRDRGRADAKRPSGMSTLDVKTRRAARRGRALPAGQRGARRRRASRTRCGSRSSSARRWRRCWSAGTRIAVGRRRRRARRRRCRPARCRRSPTTSRRRAASALRNPLVLAGAGRARRRARARSSGSSARAYFGAARPDGRDAQRPARLLRRRDPPAREVARRSRACSPTRARRARSTSTCALPERAGGGLRARLGARAKRSRRRPAKRRWARANRPSRRWPPGSPRRRPKARTRSSRGAGEEAPKNAPRRSLRRRRATARRRAAAPKREAAEAPNRAGEKPQPQLELDGSSERDSQAPVETRPICNECCETRRLR